MRWKGRAVEFELLQAIPDQERRAVLAATVRRKYRKGEIVFHEGDLGDVTHLLAKGRVAIRVSTPLGEVTTLAVLGPGETFGEQALLGPDSRRTASVVALEVVETLTIHRNDFEDLRDRYPKVERFLVELLARQVRRLSAQLLDALFMPADKRLVRRLNDLVGQYDGNGHGGDSVTIPLTQEDLASMSGVTRPTVNRALQELVAANVVTLRRGSIEVLDRDEVRARAAR